MTQDIQQELLLTWPGLLALFLLFSAVLPKRIFARFSGLLSLILKLAKQYTPIDLSGWLSSVSDTSAQRITLVAVAMALIIFIPFRDYSTFFPTNFSIQVYFDESGLRKALVGFDKPEQAAFRITPNWESKRRAYFSRLDSELKVHELPFSFGTPDKGVHGSGWGTIKATAIQGWARQRYEISEADGCIRLSRDTPPGQLPTYYTLRPSPSNTIDLGLLDVYLMRPLVITPSFDQRVAPKATDTPFRDHTLVTATRLRFLPAIEIGTTLYLYEQADGTRLPIGYAIYTPTTGSVLRQCLL